MELFNDNFKSEIIMNTSEKQSAIFPKGVKAPAEYFTGNTEVSMLVPNDATLNCQIGNVVFEPGARNNWHTHAGGQILLVTNGNGYYQEKGKPIQLLHKGDVVTIPPDTVHWHGATPDSQFTHIAINPNTQKGIVTWLERVTEEEYKSFK
jgi:quercetin dioxygenase-like cupin family protein